MTTPSLKKLIVLAFISLHVTALCYWLIPANGYPKDELTAFTKRISGVSVADVLEVGKKYYRPEGTKIAVVGDASKFDGPLDRFGPVTRVTLDELDK